MTHADLSHQGQVLAAGAWEARLAAHQDGWVRTLSQWQGARSCAHCWHSPRVWHGPLPVPRQCCWCGGREGPPHGPYAEG